MTHKLGFIIFNLSYSFLKITIYIRMIIILLLCFQQITYTYFIFL